jgi:hypothetical protein
MAKTHQDEHGLVLDCCHAWCLLQKHMVGINGAFGTFAKQWELPLQWQAPPQLRVLKIASPAFQALSSLRFDNTDNLRLLCIDYRYDRNRFCRVDTSDKGSLPSKLFADLLALTMLQLNCGAFKQWPDFGPWALPLTVLVLEECKVERLPKGIGNMSNLQVLILRSCWHVGRLPHSIVRLRNLRQLEIHGGKRCPLLANVSFNEEGDGWPHWQQLPGLTGDQLRWLKEVMKMQHERQGRGKHSLYAIKFSRNV